MAENSFKKVQARHEAELPPELELELTQQVGALNVGSQVVDTFGPRAIDTLLRYISGDTRCADTKGPGQYYDEEPDWRFPPGFRPPGR